MIGFMQGPNGENSSTRMVMTIVVVGIIATWGVSSIISAIKGVPNQVNIPWEVVTLGIAAITGKVANSALSEAGKQQ